MGKIRPEKEKKERKKKAAGAAATARGFSFRTVADLRLLLVVAALVLAAMGIFAWAFRQIHIGYVEEDGYVVTNSSVYSSLNSGGEEGLQYLMAGVASDDEVFSRGGNYYVGADMVEYLSAYPVYANSGLALYFMDDSASLVTEDFELLSTYLGMYVAAGTSFNADHTQADIETIYLVKLKNGLYENALSIRFVSGTIDRTMKLNSIASFQDSVIRWFEPNGEELNYREITDTSDLTVYIGDDSYSYEEFLELLRGAGSVEKTDEDISGPVEDEADADTGDYEAEEEEEGASIPSSDSGESVKTKNDTSSKDDSDGATKSGDTGTAEASASGEGNSSAGSAAGSTGSGSGASADTDTAEAEGGAARSSSSGNSSGEATEAGYQAPTVTVTLTSVGVYSADVYVTIIDESGVFRKASLTAVWGDYEVRKSVREDGSYTISNLESGQQITLKITVKYRNSSGDYVEAELEAIVFTTLTIEEGTNTLYISYTADQQTRDEMVYDEETETWYYPGYEQLYAKQIEIQDLKVTEGTDGLMDESTMDYVRYFRVTVYEITVTQTENGDGSVTVTRTLTGEDGTTYSLTSAERKNAAADGIDWKSDSATPLATYTDYCYGFELTDRYGAELKVEYGTGPDDLNEACYDDSGNQLDDIESDRMAYTCSAAPTGKLTLGGATYQSQTVSVTLKNSTDTNASSSVGGADIKELYLTEQDAWSRYTLWALESSETTDDDGKTVTVNDVVGKVGTSEQTADDGWSWNYSLMETSTAGYTCYLNLGKGESSTEDADGTGVGYTSEVDYTVKNLVLPAFASNTYKIQLVAVYDIGDRQGDYTATLATRSNCRTSALSTLGSVSFTRKVLEEASDTVSYSYTSGTVNASLQALLYKYEYSLVDADGTGDDPFTLTISKEYDDEAFESVTQGIVLTTPLGTVEANDWSANYSFTFRDDSTGTEYVITGTICYSNGYVYRTIEVDGVYVADATAIAVTSSGDSYTNAAICTAFATALGQLTSYETAVGNYYTIDSSITYTTVVEEATVSLDFPSITESDGKTMILDVNDTYSFSVIAESLQAAAEALVADAADGAAADDDLDWSDLWLNVISQQYASLGVTVSDLASSCNYTAYAYAYAYQSGALDGSDDSDEVSPTITSVTTSDSSLALQTLKGDPTVYMDIFSTSSELTLYGFYVEDPDGAIVARKTGGTPSVTISVYAVDEDGTETLITTETLTDYTTAQDVVFTGLDSGTTYLLKVTADAYDSSTDGTNRQYDVLIGTGERYYVSTGTWEVTLGADVETGLFLERVASEDPYTLEGQLLDYTVCDSDVAEGDEYGWQVGYLSGGETITTNTSYRVTPYIDLRERLADGTVDTDDTLDGTDVFLLRGIYQSRVYLYDADYSYLGYVYCLRSGSGEESYALLRLNGKALSGAQTSDYNPSQVVYARMSVYYSDAEYAYFGRLDDGYLTTSDASGATPGEDYNDIFTQMTGQTNSNYFYYTDGSCNLGSTKTIKDTSGSSTATRYYYSKTVDISGYDTAVFLLTGTGYLSSGTATNLTRYVRFYDENDEVITLTNSDGTTTTCRKVATNSLFVAPSDAVSMQLSAYNGASNGATYDANSSNLGLYIIEGSGIAQEYNDWRNEQQVSVTANKYINTSGNLTTYSSSSSNPELIQYIPVYAGHMYLLSAYVYSESYCYVTMYDANKNFVTWSRYVNCDCNYLLVPSGVSYISISYGRNDSTADWSILSGYQLDSDAYGCYQIMFYDLGDSISDVWAERLAGTPGDSTRYGESAEAYGSDSEYYANLRIHISDAEDGTNFTGTNTFWLEVYRAEAPASASDDEVSDDDMELVDTYAETFITIDDAGQANVDLCRFVPVELGYSYRVELWATRGSQDTEVHLGTSWFTAEDSSDATVYAVSSEAQFAGLSGSSLSYVLTQDVTLSANSSGNAGTFTGSFDLQGHTLTLQRDVYLFTYLGTSGKRTAVLKNGTIALDYERTSGGTARVIYWCYGTVQNLEFKVNEYNPVLSGEGNTAVYDNSVWTKEYYSYLIERNYGTLRNFSVEYESDLVSPHMAGFIAYNYGTVENAYLYGDGCVRGGGYVGGLVYQNTSSGVVRGVFSTIDVKANYTSKTDMGASSSAYITTRNYAGTIIGYNQGTAQGLLSTGNVYYYTTSYDSSTSQVYSFTDVDTWTEWGCAVGKTGAKRGTSDAYYATVGTSARVSYYTSTSSSNTYTYESRVESGLLVDADWWEALYAGTAYGLQEDVLDSMLTGGYYPWVSMGVAADKYSILQSWVEMDVTSSSSFDLIRSEEVSRAFDDEGYETVTVKFSFLNPNEYTVQTITIMGLSCELVEGSQEMNEDTGFWEVTAKLTVSSGSYTDSYNVSTVRYTRTASGGGATNVRYTTSNYTSAYGERIVDVSFYYPLRNTQEWVENFVADSYSGSGSSIKYYCSGNYRIWNTVDESGNVVGDSTDWDFLKTYTDSNGNTVYPCAVKTFYFTGVLDGTLYEKNSDGEWVVATDEYGTTKTHVLKNMTDYDFTYTTGSSAISGVSYRGGVFLQLGDGTTGGTIRNLTIEDFTAGLLRAEHETVFGSKAPTTSGTLSWNGESLGRISSSSVTKVGFVANANAYSAIENVHLVGGCIAPALSANEYIGALVGYSNGSLLLTGCSATETWIATSDSAATLYAGGLLGYGGQFDEYESCYVADVDIDAVYSTSASFSQMGVGGLVGRMEDAAMTGCYSSGSLDSEGAYTGGLIGRVLTSDSTATVKSCYSAMSLTLGGVNSGGLIGSNEGTLTMNGCLYTGALSAVSLSGTVHMLLGNNAASASLEGCYTYQPNISEDSALLDSDATLLVEASDLDSTLYVTLFGEEGSLYLHTWGDYGVDSSLGGYLPALADGDGNLLLGQVVGSVCHVPFVVSETLTLSDVWAYSSAEHDDALQLKTGSDLYRYTSTWYSGESFSSILDYYSQSAYTPNDVEFTLSLGDYYAYGVQSIELEGFATLEDGGLFVTDGTTYLTEELDDAGTASFDYTESTSFTTDTKLYGYYVQQISSGTYRIHLRGGEVVSYQDTYTIIVTLKNGIMIKQTYQFLNSDGEEDAKYLQIEDAIAWNLYMAGSGELDSLLENDFSSSGTNLTGDVATDYQEVKALAEDTSSDYQEAAEELLTLLETYEKYDYYGYASSSMNIEIADDIDFRVLDVLNDCFGVSETPALNVVANNVRGAADGTSGSGVGDGYPTISNLNYTSMTSTDYGLFRSVGGALTNLNFENVSLEWKSSAAAPAASGLVGTLSGGMTNVSFTDITLTQGGTRFGIVGDASGALDTVALYNVLVYTNSTSGYAGGLAGRLYGDLVDVSAEYIDVEGYSYVGALVGALYSTEHEESGHSYIGGEDNVALDGDGSRTDYTTYNSDGSIADTDADWYADLMSDDTNYLTTQKWFYVDSLSCDYTLVDNVSVTNAAVSARSSYAGVVAGYEGYTTANLAGYGYAVVQDLTLTDITVNARGNYAGGVFGYARALMAHDIDVDGLKVDASTGSSYYSYVGGLVGYLAGGGSYDYSGYTSDGTDRAEYFLSAITDVDYADISLTGGAGSGGLLGYVGRAPTIIHDIKLSEVTVLVSNGRFVGSLVGYAHGGSVVGNAVYTTDLTANGIQVYNTGQHVSSGSWDYYTGGLYGSSGYLGGTLTVSDVLVTTPGQATRVGGLSGDQTTATYVTSGTVTNVRVYGRSVLGGLSGYNSSWKNLSVSDVTVSGNGYSVGGLVGDNYSSLSYLTVTGVTVTGGGAKIGGVAGQMTAGSITHCDFSDITVTATATSGFTTTGYLDSNSTTSTVYPGWCVGGLVGAQSSNSSSSYNTLTNVTVYSAASASSVSGEADQSIQYVGGLYGSAARAGLSWTSVSGLTVYAPYADYVGGAIGSMMSPGTYSIVKVVMEDVEVTGRSYVGGLVGYVATSNSSYYTNLYLNQVQATIVATGDDVGGLVGYGARLYHINRNSVEADIDASDSEYVGGLIGYMLTRSSYSCYNNQVVTDVTGENYVSGMIGYAEGALGSKVYRNVVAAQVKATDTDAVVSYFYYYADSDTGTAVKDYSPSSDSDGYPYTLYLWDESTLTTGYGTTSVSSTAATAVEDSGNVTVEATTFSGTAGTSAYTNGTDNAAYWIGANGSKYTYSYDLSDNRYRISLVSAEHLASTTLYGGTANSGQLNYSQYSTSLVVNTVYTDSTESTIDYQTVSIAGAILASGDYWNLYGLYTSMTTPSGYQYLPSPINPLSLCRALAVDVDGSNYFVGNSNNTDAPGWFFGSAEYVDGDTSTLSFTITDGICVPGTGDSILSSGYSATLVGAKSYQEIELVTTPEVYRNGAYKINVEFGSTDHLVEDAYICVYTDYYDADENGDLGYVCETEITASAWDDNKEATAFNLSYTLLYDYNTPITIEVANAAYGDTSGKRQVAITIDVDPDAISSRVASAGKYLYAIGSNGLAYQYYTAWTDAAEEIELSVTLNSDEQFVNIYSDGTNVTAITNEKRVVLLTGSELYHNYQLNVVAAPSSDDNSSCFTALSGTSGSTERMLLTADVRTIASGDSSAEGSSGESPVGGAGETLCTSVSEASDAAEEAALVALTEANRFSNAGGHYLTGKNLLRGSLVSEIRMLATADGTDSGGDATDADEGSGADTSAGDSSGESSSDDADANADSSDSGTLNADDEEAAGSSVGTQSDATAGSADADAGDASEASGAAGSGSGTQSDATADSASADSDEEDADSGSSASVADSSEESLSDDVSDTSASGTSDSGADEDSDTVEFDASLLEADPLYEFDYGGYHICTYLNYTLIYDEDGDVTLRNMQLFVKNGQLFALNAPEEIVPGCIIIDTYQGNTYMTVLRNDGVMVDLMDELNYPDDFRNYSIKNISDNLYSDLTYVQVEYEDGSIVTFNYLTGSVVFETEAEDSDGSGTMSFWEYLSTFFRSRFDSAYAEISGAYANAKELKDYLSELPWRSLFAGNEDADNVDGDAEGEEALTVADALEADESTASEKSSADASSDETGDILTSLTDSDAEGVDSDDGTVTDGTLETLSGADGSEGSESEETEEESTVATEGDVDSYIEGVMAVSEDVDSSLSGSTTSEEEGAASDDTAADESESADIGLIDGEADSEDGPDADSSAAETEAGTESGLTEEETAKADASESADSDTEEDSAFDDEIIIAYDADANGYALYAANDLLTGSSGTVASVDSRLRDYVDEGGELSADGVTLLSLEISSQQRNGLVILALIGGAAGLMLVVLLVQRSARRRRRSGHR